MLLKCPASVSPAVPGRDGEENECFLSRYQVLKSTCEKSVGLGEATSWEGGYTPDCGGIFPSAGRQAATEGSNVREHLTEAKLLVK